jgi:hypothetical protein
MLGRQMTVLGLIVPQPGAARSEYPVWTARARTFSAVAENVPSPNRPFRNHPGVTNDMYPGSFQTPETKSSRSWVRRANLNW